MVFAFVLWHAEPLKAGAVLAAAGISIPWLVREMRALWIASVQVEILLALASTLDPAIVTSVVKTILKNMDAKGRWNPR